MSSTQRIFLSLGVTIAAILGYLIFQSSYQEVETQPVEGGQSISPTYKEGKGREFASDKIIVKIEDDATQSDLEAINRGNEARTEDDLPRSDVSVVDLPGDLPVEEAIELYEASPDVEYAEPDFLLQPAQTSSPDDPDYSKLYGLNNTGQSGGSADADIDASEAWGTTTGDSGVVVAVIDEGIDVKHPDLVNNIWTNPGESGSGKETNGIDDDANGYVDDVNGWDFANNDKGVYDPDPVSGAGDEHGTHVAGTIAAQGNNGIGITGVSWQTQIMPLKFLGADGGYTSDAVEAINYAVDRGVKISNNSWGGGGFSQALSDAISRADAKGHIFVAAAGNGGADGVGDDNDAAPHYPSNYNIPNVVSVAASDASDALASFSNYGVSSVDVAAPGVRILSTLPGNTYGSYSGTSMATPHISGIAALLRAKDPSLDDAQLKAQLLQSVDAKGSLSGKVATGGRANSAQALGINPPPPDTTAPDTSISSGPSGTTRSTSANFGFVASEAVSRFECSLDGAAFAACSSPKAYSGLTSKAHSFRVRAVDRAGNVDGTPAVRNWTVDTVIPTVTAPSPAPGASTRDRTPLVRATARDTQTNLQKTNLKLYFDGARITTFTYDAGADVLRYTPTTRAYGTHTVNVVATDAAGNVGSRKWSFKIVR